MTNGIPQGANQRESVPVTMKLAETVVAAGLAGKSVTLGLDGYPALLLCGMCRVLSRRLGVGCVTHVHGRLHRARRGNQSRGNSTRSESDRTPKKFPDLGSTWRVFQR